jgi:Flp pilus assembly protein TadG
MAREIQPDTARKTERRALAERGSALVEFALSASILLTMVFGVIDLSLALYSYHFTAEAAREGARYAIVRGSSCATYGNFSSNCPVTTSAQIQTYLRSLSFPGITSTNITVTATWPTIGSACTPSTSPCNNPGNLVRVKVSYTLPLTIPFVPNRVLTMESTSQMVIAD